MYVRHCIERIQEVTSNVFPRDSSTSARKQREKPILLIQAETEPAQDRIFLSVRYDSSLHHPCCLGMACVMFLQA